MDAEDGEKGPGWYDEAYTSPDNIYCVHYTQSMYYFLWAVIVDRMSASARVLEIGCGTGQLASYLMARGVSGYIGFDFSPQAVALARERCPGMEFHVADARDTELLERSDYDTVVCTEVLEHIEADVQVLRRVREEVRCLLTVPSFPYTSHVRHFESSEAVISRYGSMFRSYRVNEFLKNPVGDRYYLLDGIRGDGTE